MKGKIPLLLVFFILIIIAFIDFQFDLGSIVKQNLIKNAITKVEDEKIMGLYTFQNNSIKDYSKTSQHYRLKLHNNREIKIPDELRQLFNNKIPIFITIETYSDRFYYSYQSNPLNRMVNQEYDMAIKPFLFELKQSSAPIFLRLNPEMEVPSDKYPWQWYLHEHIAAFQYFYNLVKENAPTINLIWGPSGYPGTLEFYPGDQYTDFLSVTLNSNSEKELTVYPKYADKAYDLYRRIHRLRFVNKPIFILSTDSTIDYTTLLESVKRHKNEIYNCYNSSSSHVKNSLLNENFEIGLYDPYKLLVHKKQLSTEHLFVDFQSLQNGEFLVDLEQVSKRGHNLILTFEPFRAPNNLDERQVVKNITKGLYDNELKQFFDIIRSFEKKIYLRFAHEMEIPITRYPWQSMDPIEHIALYRYFMNFDSKLPTTIKKVWGPAGDRGSIEWYPGNDVVDYISIAIYGLPDKNITDPLKQESFKKILDRKTWRFRYIDKPIFITEFGVKGEEKYQTEWLINAAKTLKANQNIVGINYFNMTDTPKAWGDIKPPDWSISEESFDQFINELHEF